MSTTVTKIDTIADLIGQSPSDGDLFEVAGYYAPGDRGGGLYRWDDGDSTTQPNYGSVIGVWNTGIGPPGYLGVRYKLVHDGVVTARQFGALGDGSGDALSTQTGTGLRFEDSGHLAATYPPVVGKPFSGLLSSDTVDWAALQASEEWCAEFGVQLQVPAGVYKCARPLWLGDDASNLGDEVGDKDQRQSSFTLVGQTHVSRKQAGSYPDEEGIGGSANIRLVSDCTNRFCLSVLDPAVAFKLRATFEGVDAVTEELDDESTADDVKEALQAALDGVLVDTFLVDLEGTDAGAVCGEENVYFSVRLDPTPTPAFLGEVLAVDSGDPDAFLPNVHCFPDCAILSFRRSAGNRMRVEDFTLKGNADNADDDRFASFGVLFATSQFVGHVLERLFVSYSDTVLGLLKGTGANGEWTRVSRLAAEECRRGYLSNAPQAFSQEFDGWNLGLDNDGVFAEFFRVGVPGVGANFANAHCTFGGGGNPDGNGTLVRLLRGTGVLQFNSGRIEHMARLVQYDSVDDQGANDDLDLFVRGMEFDGLRGGSDEGRSFVFGEPTPEATLGTNYGLYVSDCTFRTFYPNDPEDTDLVFVSDVRDNVRCVFERCRFVAVRSFQMSNFKADFSRCYRNDFAGAGTVDQGQPVRQFNQSAGAPKERTQSLRVGWSDTPWVQTGPRVNLLGFSDFAGQDYSADAETPVAFNSGGSWVLVGDTDLAAFGKWGAFDEANISPSPEAFYIALLADTHLENEVTAIDLNLPVDSIEPASKVLTYQCLCKVKGKLRFAIVDEDSEDHIYDEIVVESPKVEDEYVFSDTALVTLRLQLSQVGPAEVLNPVVRIDNNAADVSAVQVFWQQAWGGSEAQEDFPLSGALSNAGHVRNVDEVPTVNTYNWAVNALGIKAASRFQLPLLDTNPDTGDAAGMGWLSDVPAEDCDLEDGAMYHDKSLNGVMGRAAEIWSIFIQPELVGPGLANNGTWQGGKEKNLLYTGTPGSTVNLNLSTDLTKVPPGTMVRVFNLHGDFSSVAVKVGGSTLSTVAIAHLSEFLFFDNGGTGTWLVVISNAPTAKLP